MRANLVAPALAVCGLTLAAALVACTDVDTFGDDEEETARLTPLKLPEHRLPRPDEEKLLEIIDDLRGPKAEYLERIKAEEFITQLIDKGQTGVVDYMVPVLNDPKWDVRAAALRVIIKHGRTCPEAVAALVQVVGDSAMNAAVRDDAARALRSWTGLYYGFNAWGDPHLAQAAAAKWKAWLDESKGVIEDVP